MATTARKRPTTARRRVGGGTRPGVNPGLFLALGIIGAGGYFGVKYFIDKSATGANAGAETPAAAIPPAGGGSSPSVPVATAAGTFPLRQGMFNNANVRYLQRALIAAGTLVSGGDDGDFGPQTAAALRAARINPDNGVSADTYNGLLTKYGLTRFLVSANGAYRQPLSGAPTLNILA